MEPEHAGQQAVLLLAGGADELHVLLDALAQDLRPVAVGDLVAQAVPHPRLAGGAGQLEEAALHRMGAGVVVQHRRRAVLDAVDHADQAAGVAVLQAQSLVQPPPEPLQYLHEVPCGRVLCRDLAGEGAVVVHVRVDEARQDQAALRVEEPGLGIPGKNMYPLRRNRRLRTTEAIRSLVRETILSPDDFIVPLFVVEGKNVKEEIASMPNYFRYSLDNLEKEVKELWSLGLKSVLLFVKVPDHLKDNQGKEAINSDGLMQRAIKVVKNAVPQIIVMTDVALDPYSVYGHDGIIENGQIVNDITVEALCQMSLSHAEAGADFVAPSDMMDGRIASIREVLENDNFVNVGIMAYSAKYASAFYGPFRDALDSAPVDATNIPKDKRTYQMDYHNRLEALRETRMDIEEGADIVMVKPGLCYLDIVREVKNMSEVPVSVYQVSGEYAMIKAAAEKGWLDHDAVMLEQTVAIKRAGADLIASYFAKDVVKLLH